MKHQNAIQVFEEKQVRTLWVRLKSESSQLATNRSQLKM